MIRLPLTSGESRALDLRLFAGVIFGVAVLLQVFFTVQVYLGFVVWMMPISWREAFLWAVPDTLLWLLLFPLILDLARRLPFSRARWYAWLGFHLATSVAVSFSTIGLRKIFELASDWSLGAPSYLLFANFYRLGIFFPAGVLLYWAVLGLHHAISYYGRMREQELTASKLETQLAVAQLEALKMQLHPHFLFNTLNAIAVLMQRDVRAATKMLNRLSDLLRVTIDSAGSQEVSVRQELEFLDSYVEIQRTRFEDRLTVDFDVDPATLDARIPNLILQPLVENAVKHGVAVRSARGRVGIRVGREGDDLVVHVSDDGPGLPPDLSLDDPGRGVGLRNTRSRLEKLYGARHRFDVISAAAGLDVCLRLPFARIDTASAHPPARTA